MLTLEGIITANNGSLPGNFTIEVVVNQSWYDSPLFGVVVGAAITFIFSILYSLWKEKGELDRYEYNLLSTTYDLIGGTLDEAKKSEIEKCVHHIVTDLRSHKIKSIVIIRDALAKTLKGEDNSGEKRKIKERIDKLK